MKRHTTNPLAVLLAAALIFAGIEMASYAATGGSVILGKTNKADKVTKLKRTNDGPVLQLKSKPGSPPLKVSSGTKVDKLNADTVDGLDAAALQTTATTRSLKLAVDNSTPNWPISLPDGQYLVSWSSYLDVTGAPERVVCGFINAGRLAYVASTKLAPGGALVEVMSGTGVVTFGPTTDERFFCNAGVGEIAAFNSVEGIEITFVPLALNPTTPSNPLRTAARPGRR